jgi:hypothetical protein
LKLFTNFSLKSKYIEYIFLEKGLPTFSDGDNLNYFKTAYNYVAVYIGNQLSFDEIINKLKIIKTNLLEKYKNIIFSAIISTKNPEKYVIKIRMRNLKMRENVGYICTDSEIVNVSICYHNVITYLTEGNQWAIDAPRMEKLINNGFNVELFGSSFNTRMKYFGCLYVDVDKPFGGLGDYEYILKTLIDGKKLMWNDVVVYGETDLIKMQIGPPCVFKLCLHLWELIKELMEKRKCEIELGFPNIIIDEIKQYKYCKNVENASEFISFEQNKIIPFGTNEYGKIKRWYFFLLSNLDQ